MKLRSKKQINQPEKDLNHQYNQELNPRNQEPEKDQNENNTNLPTLIAVPPIMTPPVTNRTELLLKELFENLDSRAAYNRALNAFIQRNEVYSKFKPVRRKFKRRKTKVHGPFNTYQIDLSDFRSLRHTNGNYGWGLFIIDAFSRYGYIIPLKYKTAKHTREALEGWLMSLNHLPKFIYSDEGNEFTNGLVQDLFNSRGITHYILKGTHKASIVERFQRTIKSSLEMYFYKTKKKNWVKAINQLVDNYNHRYHRTIGMKPAEITYENFEQVYKHLYPHESHHKLCRLHVGDLVRIAVKKKEFSKGYHQTFSDKIYKIIKAVSFNGICSYTVQPIIGGAALKKYYNELNLVLKNDSDTPRSKKIHRQRRALSN